MVEWLVGWMDWLVSWLVELWYRTGSQSLLYNRICLSFVKTRFALNSFICESRGIKFLFQINFAVADQFFNLNFAGMHLIF